MTQRIIYPAGDGISVLICHDANGVAFTDLPIAEIARKDVPAGVPFLIVDETDIPADRTERDQWTADFSTPDGHGIGQFAWHKEQLVILLDRLGDEHLLPPEATTELTDAHDALTAALDSVLAEAEGLPDVNPSPAQETVLHVTAPKQISAAVKAWQIALAEAVAKKAAEQAAIEYADDEQEADA